LSNASGAIGLTAVGGIIIGQNTNTFAGSTLTVLESKPASNVSALPISFGAMSSTDAHAGVIITQSGAALVQLGSGASLQSGFKPVGGNTGAGSVTITSAGGVNLGTSSDLVSNGGSVSITSSGSTVVGDSATVKAIDGNLGISSGGALTIATTSSLNTGLGAVLSATAVAGNTTTQGAITLSSNNSELGINGLSNVNAANGMSITAKGIKASLVVDDGAMLASNGTTDIVNQGTGGSAENFSIGTGASIVDPTGVLSIMQSSTAGQTSASLIVKGNVTIQSSNGAINLTSTGALTFGASGSPSSISAGKTVSLSAAGVTLVDGTSITSGGNLTVNNTGSNSPLVLNNNVALTAGSFKQNVTVPSFPTAIPTSDVNVAGNITLQSSGSFVGIGLVLNSGDTVLAKGGNVLISTSISSGGIGIDDKYSITAAGGNVTISSAAASSLLGLSIGSASGTSSSSITAQKLGTVGGAVNFSAPGKVFVGVGAIQSGSATTISGTLANGSVQISGSTIAATSANITSTGGTTIDTGANISALNNLTISATAANSNLSIAGGTSVVLSAGTLKQGFTPNGNILTSNIATAGTLSISAPSVSITSTNDNITANGGNLLITSTLAPAANQAPSVELALGSSNSYTANGGNIQILAKSDVSGGTANKFTAFSQSTTSSPSTSTGGGIEVGAGLTTSTNVRTALNSTHVPQTPTLSLLGSVSANVLINTLNSSSGNTGGIIQVNTTKNAQGTSGAINLTANSATVNLNPGTTGPTSGGGAQVFDALGGTSVSIQGGTFITSGLKPIAMVTKLGVESPDDMRPVLARDGANTKVSVGDNNSVLRLFNINNERSVIIPVDQSTLDSKYAGKVSAQVYAKPRSEFVHNANGQISLTSGEVFVDAVRSIALATDTAQIEAAKGALLSLRAIQGTTYVKACSGLASVRVLVNSKAFELNAGEELVVTSHRPDSTELRPADGVARRSTHSVQIGNKFVTISDFAIMTMLVNSTSLADISRSSEASGRRVVDRLIKSAATVDMVLRYRGAYSMQAR
jgi:hypothetical protein